MTQLESIIPEPVISELAGGSANAPISTRDNNGLVKNVKHKFDANGLVDWKAMIPAQFLSVKKEYITDVVKRYGKEINELDLSTVDDFYLYIRLGGMNYLANLRGYTELRHHVDYVSHEKCVDTCHLTLIPNFESNFLPVTCGGVASATIHNVSNGFEGVLETIAENRAFSRAVRRALRINIVTQEELGDKKATAPGKNVEDSKNTEVADASSGTSFNPSAMLATVCNLNGISFEKVKQAAVSSGGFVNDPNSWGSFSDIQPKDVFTILSRIEAAKKKKS